MRAQGSYRVARRPFLVAGPSNSPTARAWMRSAWLSLHVKLRIGRPRSLGGNLTGPRSFSAAGEAAEAAGSSKSDQRRAPQSNLDRSQLRRHSGLIFSSASPRADKRQARSRGEHACHTKWTLAPPAKRGGYMPSRLMTDGTKRPTAAASRSKNS